MSMRVLTRIAVQKCVCVSVLVLEISQGMLLPGSHRVSETPNRHTPILSPSPRNLRDTHRVLSCVFIVVI